MSTKKRKKKIKKKIKKREKKEKKRGKWILLAIGPDNPYFFRRRSIEEKILRRSTETVFQNSARNRELWSLEVGGRSKNTTFLKK